MPETQKFSAPELELSRLVTALTDWYRGKSFKVQQIDMQDGGVLVQTSQGGWRNVVGMSSALNITLRHVDSELAVEVGAGKWIDKAAVGTVSMFMLWPLAVTTAYGAWKQSQLPKQTFEFIQQYLSGGKSSSSVSVSVSVPGGSLSDPSPVEFNLTVDSNDSSPATSLRFCPSCGAQVSDGDKFCSNCGYALS